MRITILMLLLVALASVEVQAQTGIRAGYNSATIGGDASGNSATAGYHVGLFFMKRNGSKGSMFEILYSSQGSEIPSIGLKVTYEYVQLPFLLHFYLSDEVFAQFGIQPGLLVSASANNGQNLKDQLKEFDFAGALGLGADFERVTLNARYNIGFTTTSKQSGHFPNMVLQFSLGLKLSSPKKEATP